MRVAGTNTVAGEEGGCIIGLCGSDPITGGSAFSRSKVNAGWTLGGGIEGALANLRNWTLKVEYLYLDLGSLDVSGATSLTFVNPAAVTAGPAVATHSRFTDHVVRVGLNYRFDGWAPGR